jgi:hypothetical protein
MPDISSYLGRTVDISAFQNISIEHSTLLSQTLAEPGKSGIAITGIAKLGQRFLLELLTERGSIRFLPARGCDFMLEARLGLIRTQSDLISAFTRSMLDVGETLTAEEEDSDSLDERFGSASIDNIQLDGSRAIVGIRLSSLDPDAQAILPVSLVL